MAQLLAVGLLSARPLACPSEIATALSSSGEVFFALHFLVFDLCLCLAAVVSAHHSSPTHPSVLLVVLILLSAVQQYCMSSTT
eukprot:5767221-Pleurochrysis_carterae.AAC.1